MKQAAGTLLFRGPHDRLEVGGHTARLKGDLLHYSYANLQDHFERMLRYALFALRRGDWGDAWTRFTGLGDYALRARRWA